MSLKPHRHYDELGALPTRFANQAARVRVRNAQFNLVAIDSRERVEQVIDVEPDFHGVPAIFDLKRLHRLFLLGIVRLQYYAVSRKLKTNTTILLVGEDGRTL